MKSVFYDKVMLSEGTALQVETSQHKTFHGSPSSNSRYFSLALSGLRTD